MATLFALILVSTFPWWLSMLLFPDARATLRMTTANWPFVTAGAVQATALIGALASGAVPASLDPADLAVTLAEPAALLAAWAQVTYLHLFAGVWIYRDARFGGGAPRLALLLTFAAGPLGIAWYLWRRDRAGRQARVVN